MQLQQTLFLDQLDEAEVQQAEPVGKSVLMAMPEVRCLSLWQPWATLMAYGSKRIETRHWPMPGNYRGLLAIHAAKKVDLEMLIHEPFYEHMAGHMGNTVDALEPSNRAMFVGQMAKWLPRGAIVSVCILGGCESTNKRTNSPMPSDDDDEYWFGNYDRDRWMWLTRNMVRLPQPIPHVGQRGLWKLEPETVALICQQVELPCM